MYTYLICLSDLVWNTWQIQTRVSGKTVCVRDNNKPTPKTDCAQGGTLSLACWDPTTNDVIFEFYCDPGKGCDTDVQFWFRLTPSPPGADVDDWCLARNSLFPHDLKEVPIPRDKEPTVKSSTTSFSSCNFLLGGICLLMLHWFAHSLENWIPVKAWFNFDLSSVISS